MKEYIFEFQKNWVDVIISYMKTNGILETTYIEKIISDVYKDKNMVGMVFLYNDINEMCDSLSNKDKESINTILEEKFGYDLEKQRLDEFNKVLFILKTNRLKNSKDLIFIEKFVNNNYDVYSKKLIEKLNLLINKYRDKFFP